MELKWELLLLVAVVTLATMATSVNAETPASEHEDHMDFDFSAFFADENTEDNQHLEHHLKEDIGLDKSVENMTDVEKDWYYFKMHDTNEDMRMDGLELLKAWQHHYLEHIGHANLDHTSGDDTEAQRKYIAEQNELFITMVDGVLKETDLNNDGYLDYLEYIMAKMKSRQEEEDRLKKEAEAKPSS